MKSKILSSALVGLVMSTSCLVNVANAGLIALYEYNDAANLGVDSSGNSNNLSISGNPMSGTGQYNGGLDLNGSSMLTSNSGTLTGLPTGNSSYTVSSWIHADSGSGAAGIIGWGNYGHSNQVNAFRLNGTNTLINYWWGNDLIANSIPDLSNTWNHVAATYDSTSNLHAIYLNGVLSASRTLSGPNVQGINFAVGKTVGNEYFRGTLDDTAIFDEALSAEQLQVIKSGDFTSYGVSSPQSVPEPSTLAIFALGIMGLASRRFKKNS